MRTWWGTREKPSPRMVVEIAAIRKLFDRQRSVLVRTGVRWDQDFYIETLSRELDTGEPDKPYWLISFQMHEIGKSRIHSRDTFTIKITYSIEHPAREPRVTLESHNTSRAPHTFRSGALCLSAHGGVRSEEWDPAKSTAATVGLWAIEWIRAWIRWEKTGHWPSTA